VNVIVLEVFVGLMLVSFALVLLAFSIRQGDHEHADRLSLLPLEPDPPPRAPAAPLARNL
jgi:hypothetical protein